MAVDHEGTAGDEVDDSSSSYGAVLTADWFAGFTRFDHPSDGSSVFVTPAAASAPDANVVLLHGVGNDGSIFGPIMPSLSHLGRVVAPTMSPRLLTDVGEDRATTTAKLVDWLSEVAPPPWCIVGHSMGGLMTGLILRTRPDLVSGAVLLNAPLPGVVRRMRTRDTLDRTGRALLFIKVLSGVTRFGRPRMPGFLRGPELAAVRVALRGFVDDPGAIDARVLSRSVLGSRTSDGSEFIRLAQGMPAWESEPFTEVPVTIVLGDVDPLVPVRDVDLIAGAYPAAPIHVLANCGHFAHLEWSRLVVDTISHHFLPNP
jgi:pimeloyl-ACP methyl ester carboxylesterase